MEEGGVRLAISLENVPALNCAGIQRLKGRRLHPGTGDPWHHNQVRCPSCLLHISVEQGSNVRNSVKISSSVPAVATTTPSTVLSVYGLGVACFRVQRQPTIDSVPEEVGCCLELEQSARR